MESLRGFLKSHGGSEPAKAAQAMLDEIAQAELDTLMETLPADPKPAQRQAAAVKLRKFVTTWPDAAATVTVRQTLDAWSDEAWAELGLSLPERTTPQQRAALAGKCRKFVADWPGSSGERAALALLGTLGQAKLDDALARLPANLTPDQGRLAAQQLRMMRKRWEATPAAGFFDAAITRLEQP